MSKRARLALSLGLVVLCAVGTLALVWWWALFGMSEDVATAWGVTIGVLFVAGFTSFMESTS